MMKLSDIILKSETLYMSGDTDNTEICGIASNIESAHAGEVLFLHSMSPERYEKSM